jgi:DNA-binding HxlR family transcriptional regulator
MRTLNDQPGIASAPTLVRQERRRARAEDFEMIERTREALALLQSKWAVDVVILLASGIRRHARIIDNAPGLSKKVLTATLRKLEDDGLVSRHVYAEIPVRVEYTLTPLGWRLTALLMALYEWAVEHETEIKRGPDFAQATGAGCAFALDPRPAA